jgi:hypothetical protein
MPERASVNNSSAWQHCLLALPSSTDHAHAPISRSLKEQHLCRRTSLNRCGTTEEVNITITITVVVTIMETAEATITTEVTITVVGSHRRGMPFQLIIPSWHVIQIPTMATMASPFTTIQLLYKRNEISTLFKQCPRSAKYLSGKSG